jgi:hypothetical protein
MVCTDNAALHASSSDTTTARIDADDSTPPLACGSGS